MYRVKITDGKGQTTERIGNCLWDVALCAAEDSHAITPRAFAVGIIAATVDQEVFSDADEVWLRTFLQHVMVPVACADSVAIALGGRVHSS